MNQRAFANEGIYHIYNRGTDKRSIFTNDSDRSRFLANLFEFNDSNPALHWKYKSEVQPRTKMVEILAYCLMPNHYHLMVRQIRDDGISYFMKKLGTGYTMYFNTKYERSGALFQGRFKSVPIERDEHLRYLPHYIHLNALDLTMPSWRQHRIDPTKATLELRAYRWSSFRFLSEVEPQTRGGVPLIDADFIREIYSPQKYSEAIASWMEDMNLETVGSIMLE